MRELKEAYRKFPEWFTTKICKNIKYTEYIEFTSLYGVNPYLFSFKFGELNMRIKLSFDRFEDMYYHEGHQDLEETYFALADKIKNQFWLEVHKEFAKKIGDIEYYE